jgi:hypothetical protein
MKEFQWTDKKVLDFARIYTRAAYLPEYKDCKKIHEKLEKFKELNEN